jgi:acyl-CoA reductase-like NAD-dependent aldehyde dehydrogenase
MSAETLTTISPITGKPILTRAGASQDDVAQLAETAQQAFKSFSKSTTLQQRKGIVARALALLDEKRHVLARELTEQMGRPIAYTAKEITTAIKRAEYMLRISSSVLVDSIEADSEPWFKRYMKREPVGVVLVIFAWNVRTVSFSLRHSASVR